MKNKKMQRILALCLATGLVLTACGTNNPGENSVSSSIQGTTETSFSVTSSENSGAGEPAVLTVWVQEDANRDYDTNLHTLFL